MEIVRADRAEAVVRIGDLEPGDVFEFVEKEFEDDGVYMMTDEADDEGDYKYLNFASGTLDSSDPDYHVRVLKASVVVDGHK